MFNRFFLRGLLILINFQKINQNLLSNCEIFNEKHLFLFFLINIMIEYNSIAIGSRLPFIDRSYYINYEPKYLGLL